MTHDETLSLHDLVAVICAASLETFVHSKYANSATQFCYFECELFAVFIKILFDN